MLAYRHAERVSSITVMNSTFATETPFHLYAAAQLELMKGGAPAESLIRASCAWAFSWRYLSLPGVLDRLIQRSLHTSHPFSIAGYEGQYAAIDRFDSRTWCHQIRTPTLVIGGDQDLIFRESLVQELAAKIPHAQYHRFVECGHLPMVEHPEELISVVDAFIRRLS
jgi:3-oxoadipate enol-lactonase